MKAFTSPYRFIGRDWFSEFNMGTVSQATMTKGIDGSHNTITLIALVPE